MSAPGGLTAARHAADRFLSTGLLPSDEVAIATYDSGLRPCRRRGRTERSIAARCPSTCVPRRPRKRPGPEEGRATGQGRAEWHDGPGDLTSSVAPPREGAYIQRMRTVRLSLLILTVLSSVGPFLPALACGQSSAGDMPCCKPATHCDLRIGTASCCRVVPVPATPVAAGVVSLTTGSESLLRAHAPSLVAIDLTFRVAASIQFHSLRSTAIQDTSVPLFLRNASIRC